MRSPKLLARSLFLAMTAGVIGLLIQACETNGPPLTSYFWPSSETVYVPILPNARSDERRLDALTALLADQKPTTWKLTFQGKAAAGEGICRNINKNVSTQNCESTGAIHVAQRVTFDSLEAQNCFEQALGFAKPCGGK